ncbi:MAG: lipid II flippase MurJ [Actinomycetota bacterium]
MNSAASHEKQAPASPAAARIGRTAATIAVVAVAARFVGVLRVFTQASAIGANSLGNTYISANKIPNIVFDVVAGGALSSVVIPVLARPMAEGDDATTRRTASALLTWTVLGLVPLSALGMLLSRPLMSALLSGVRDSAQRHVQVDVGARMLVVFMPQVVLYGAGIVLTGVLQAHRRFLAPALAPLLSSLVVIGAYLAYAAQAHGAHSIASLSRAEELTLSLGTTLGVAALTLPLLVPTRRLGLHLRPTLRLPAEAGRQIRRLALAGAIGLGAQQLATGVVIVLANRLDGGLVVYELAWTLFMVPWAVLAVPIATSVFPELTASAAAGDDASYTDSTYAALRAVMVVMLLAGAVLVAAARPLADLLLTLAPAQSGSAGAADLGRAIAGFAPGLVGYGLVALLTRAAYARHAGKAAAISTAGGFAVAAVVDVVLVGVVPRHWLVAALGAGNTVGMSVAAAALLWWLRGATEALRPRRLRRLVVVGFAAAAIGSGAGRLSVAVAPTGGAARAALAAVAAIAVTIVIFIGVCAAGLRPEFAAIVGRLPGRRALT